MHTFVHRPTTASRAAAVLALALGGLLGSHAVAAPPVASAAAGTAAAQAAPAPSAKAAHLRAAATDPLVARGRYLVQVAGCNDCHTPHYPEKAGAVPEQDWLVGIAAVGWNGPWGTTYSTNLRRRLAELTEEQWMATARAPRRPPMPWFALRDMEDQDLRAIYRYVRSLGTKGEHVPAAVPPGGEVRTPVIVFAPTLPAAPQADAKAAGAARAASHCLRPTAARRPRPRRAAGIERAGPMSRSGPPFRMTDPVGLAARFRPHGAASKHDPRE